MVDLIQKIRHREILWYPACGEDLRPLHHVAFNNFYINPSILIFNDINDSLDFSELSFLKKDHTSFERNESTVLGMRIKIYTIRIEWHNKEIVKKLIFFPVSNHEMYSFLAKSKIFPKSVLLYQLNDAYTHLNTSWLNVFQSLRVKYVYTDNWVYLDMDINDTFRNTIQRTGVKYISQQSYEGFKLSDRLNAKVETEMNNCFYGMLHLFEIPTSKTSNVIG